MPTPEILVMVAVTASVVFVVRRESRPGSGRASRLPWLLPTDFVAAMESIASAHPVRYVLLVFLAWLGICALGAEAGGNFGPMLRYGVGTLVALVALYTARAGAKEHAA